jgi:polyhydroxybutyrate depolymerase
MGETQRTFILYIPGSYDADTASPLLIALHGTPGNGPGMRVSTGLDALADDEGWLIAYPNGVGGSWAAGCLCSDSDLAGVDDLGFVDRLIGRVDSEYRVDDDRVYAVGFSAGGIMSYRIGCDRADAFAGIASIGSSMTWAQKESCNPIRPVPLLSMIGTNDASFPWNGSGTTAGQTMPIDSTFSFWGRANGCSEDISVDETVPGDGPLDVRRETYDACSDGSEVTRYVIEDGIHAWPLTANETLRSFFMRHRLR